MPSEIAVFGSLIMDIVAFADHHPAVGETVIGRDIQFFPGGKGANQALAAAQWAGTAQLIGAVGADNFGRQLTDFLADRQVDMTQVKILPNMPTGAAIVTVASDGQNNIVVIPGANSGAQAPAAVAPMTIALAQLEVPVSEVLAFFRLVRDTGGTTILNPSPYQPLDRDLLATTTYLVVNEIEFAQLTGTIATTDRDILGARLYSLPIGIPNPLVTLGPSGVIFKHGDSIHYLPGYAVAAIDTTGAGDCFVGTLAACLGEGMDLPGAARIANAAAALSVTRAGAGPSMPGRAAVEAFMANHHA